MLTLCAGMNHCFLMKDKATALVLWTALICFQKRALIANLLFYVCLPVCLCPFFLSFLPSFFFSLLSSFFVTKVATWKEMQVRQPWYGKLFCFSKKTRPLQKFLDFIALLFGRAIWLIPRPGTEPELQQWKPRILTTAAPRIKFFPLYTKTNPVGSENRWVFLYMLSSRVTHSGSFSTLRLCNPTLNMFSYSLRWQAHAGCWEHCAEGPLFDPAAIMRHALKWDLSASKMDQSDAVYLWGNVASLWKHRVSQRGSVA